MCFNLPVDCQFDLFDKIVVPVLLYGCEIWGYENIEVIERVHLKFLKYVFNLKSSTPSYMVYGETGRFPLCINVYTRMISYWSKLFTNSESKIVSVLYKFLVLQYQRGNMSNSWIVGVKNILDMCGFSNIWYEQNIVNVKWISTIVKQRLQDQYIQKWSSDINDSSKGQIYKIFKKNFNYENYINILPLRLRKVFMKFRTSNHHLLVETGRWYNTPLNQRVCKLCNSGQIADEFHYILECKELLTFRRKYLDEKYWSAPNTIKFCELMSCSNATNLKKLCYFIIKIYSLI